MSVLYKSCIVRRLWAVFLGLPLLCACSLVNDKDDPVEPSPSTETAHYINLNIVVSSGNENAMRVPTGETDDYENGDGREKGFWWEYEVTGVTLMLYEDTDGINTKNDNAELAFIQYYSVKSTTLESDERDDEIAYTTGDQPLQGLDLNKTYHAIVVANLDLTRMFQVGSPVKTRTVEGKEGVREYVTEKIFSTGEGIGTDARGFVMASEKDFTINFSNPAEKEVSGNKIYYRFGNIYIERLAARVDFWMRGAERYSNADEGYVYTVKDGENDTKPDKFVLKAVTPFNLYDRSEYIIKRITKDEPQGDIDYSKDIEVLYLADERYTTGKTHRNYVLDPLTGSKTGNEIPEGYMKSGYALDDFLKETGSTYDDKRMLMSEFKEDKYGTTALYQHTESNTTADDIIVCYPKENTLWMTSPLYYYATGLCIEGIYYENGNENGELRKYYGFLRHQGETTNAGYYEIVMEDGLDKYKQYNNPGLNIFPMNYGVVRNNIYRAYIHTISKKTKEITLHIRVKKWDTFTHETIFM